MEKITLRIGSEKHRGIAEALPPQDRFNAWKIATADQKHSDLKQELDEPGIDVGTKLCGSLLQQTRHKENKNESKRERSDAIYSIIIRE